MVQIVPGGVTPALRSLFRTDEPQARRCFAVLDDRAHAGKIIADAPANPTWGVVWEAYDGVTYLGGRLEKYLRQVPEGCRIRRLDRELIMRTEWEPADVQFAGGIEAWQRTCFGFCLMRGDEILCEATTGPSAIGLREPGVFTRQDQRGKGYATITSARLIKEIEAMGDRTYWNCARQNVASAAVARKLGYRIEKEYRCMAWSKL
jgi:RimJ/RimL family protein N-acetyltransferase